MFSCAAPLRNAAAYPGHDIWSDRGSIPHMPTTRGRKEAPREKCGHHSTKITSLVISLFNLSSPPGGFDSHLPHHLNPNKMRSIKRLLAQDFTSEVFRVLKENPNLKLYEAMDVAVQRPAPRFYISSYDTAIRFIGYIMRGKPLLVRNPNKAAMYRELHRRYTEQYGRQRVSYDRLLEIASQPAPSYFCAPCTLRQLFYIYRRKNLK